MTIPTLKEAIDAFRANDIGQMIRLAGIAEIPKTKDGKTLLWVQLLGDAGRVREALRKLNARSRKALELLQQAGGELRTARFRDLLERNGLLRTETKKKSARDAWYAAQPEQASDPASFEEILATLLKWGLIWTHTLPGGSPTNAKLGFEGGRYVYIPPEVARHLPPAPPRSLVEVQVAHVLEGSARTCQRDLYLSWSVAREAPYQLTNAGLLRVSDLKRIAPQLLVTETIATGSKEGDYRRIFFLRRLLSALGLLQARQSEGATTWEATADPAFFSASPTKRVEQCFLAWRDGAWWNELWPTSPSRTNIGLSDFAPKAVVQARQSVLDALVHLARGGAAWVPVDELNDHLRSANDEFLIDRETAESTHYGYYYGSRFSASPYIYNALQWAWDTYQRDNEAGWDGVEGVFIRTVLAEGLHWLGLVDLGYLRPVTPEGGLAPAGLVAVRLTEMGRWLLLHQAPPEIPAEGGRVVVQPNFRIFAFDPIADSVLAQLDSFAVRLNAERAIEYELSRESIYRALLAGRTVTEICAWLERVSGAAMPQNVGRSLAEWQTAFERISIRPKVGCLQVAHPELADAIEADPDLRVAVISRVSPTSLLIHAALVDEVEQALLEKAELPERTTRAEDARRAGIVVAADGGISFTHAMPNLYLFSYLRPLADQAEEGWRVTQASVERARRAGLTAPAIVNELAALSLGGVPALLERRIKAWAKHYGDASAHALTLVQFRDQAALDELLADSELAALLKPFHPEAKLGLATTLPKHLERLRGLLAARGVTLD
jgi:hypothetical protein